MSSEGPAGILGGPRGVLRGQEAMDSIVIYDKIIEYETL